MKTTSTVILQKETVEAMAKVPAGCINARAQRLGLFEGEPVLVIADALLSYAKAYKARFEDTISDDHVLGDSFRDMLAGVKAMLDYDGAVAMRRGITTDSKDNAAMSEVIEATCNAAGIDYQEL